MIICNAIQNSINFDCETKWAFYNSKRRQDSRQVPKFTNKLSDLRQYLRVISSRSFRPYKSHKLLKYCKPKNFLLNEIFLRYFLKLLSQIEGVIFICSMNIRFTKLQNVSNEPKFHAIIPRPIRDSLRNFILQYNKFREIKTYRHFRHDYMLTAAKS